MSGMTMQGLGIEQSGTALGATSVHTVIAVEIQTTVLEAALHNRVLNAEIIETELTN